jgi:hypothetical protein
MDTQNIVKRKRGKRERERASKMCMGSRKNRNQQTFPRLLTFKPSSLLPTDLFHYFMRSGHGGEWRNENA